MHENLAKCKKERNLCFGIVVSQVSRCNRLLIKVLSNDLLFPAAGLATVVRVVGTVDRGKTV